MSPEEYQRLTRAHRRFVRQLLTDMDFFLEDVGPIGVHTIESRIKEFESAREKSHRMGIPIDELQDLAGIRIVVATAPEVKVVQRFFERRAEIGRDLTINKVQAVKNRAGYQSTHFLASFTGSYSRSARSGNLEVQIPTAFQHAFNFISRAWVYKSTSKQSSEWSTKFRSLSEKLAELDSLAAELHESAFAHGTIPADEQPITPLLFQRMAKDAFDEDVTTADAVDYVHWFGDWGILSARDLNGFFSNREIERLWQQFLAKDNEGVPLLHGMSRFAFWATFGTRMDFAQEYMDKVSSGEWAKEK